ncbi:type I-E CRISPR-associated protein Cse1/CasA [Desulfatibacillum aliphaticivorans]|uniref:type I-E CRISPR-associated protein Cse1/CasA n=1 Tax=Desulfatibacillum aliphaticivorans TaxID=218208 RepID=UPI0003F87B8C|nr:type I-E CRISPR-associated protein Cse1/CasA [Desulfatibacillum aliphaticivorans]
MEKRFNLVEEEWIPVAGRGLVSLRDVFSDPALEALGGNPLEKIALTKLFLAIAQTAHTPADADEWLAMGASGMASRAVEYLEEHKDCFWLYGDRPFLQMPAIMAADIQNVSAVLPFVATGNTTQVFESQKDRDLSDPEKALVLVFLSCFALGGKKVDAKIVLSPSYSEKSKTAKPGTCLGFQGFLHNFLFGGSLQETIWLNLFTLEEIARMEQFPEGLGVPPWEKMPEGEDCSLARSFKNAYMGRLLPLCRFALFADENFHYVEGIFHPGYKDGAFDPSMAVDNTKKPRVLWVDPEKRPWRELTSLLSFIQADSPRSFDCPQLRSGILKARKGGPGSFKIWSGGLRVSSNAGEQYVSGADDFVESEIRLSSQWLGETWLASLKGEMDALEGLARSVYGSSLAYFKHQKADGKKQAAQASNLFWQLSERNFQDLVDVCGSDIDGGAHGMRPRFADCARTAFNTFCPRDTARQMEAWAANRPNLSKYLKNGNSNCP